MTDVVIIGGGPAGSAAGIRLARMGLKVSLYEKKVFPRSKVCGGFISGEALPELEDLGVLERLRASGAVPIHRVVLSSSHQSRASVQLPQTALSVSRALLDSLLLNQARATGVDVREGKDGFAHAREAKWIVIAAGRRPGRLRSSRYFGIQAFFKDVSGITDQVELDFVPGGYVGLSRQEKGLVNLCALLDSSSIHRHGPDLDQVLKALASENPVLSSHLRDAKRQTTWQAVGPVTMGLRQLADRHTLYIGDAACVVDPFVGEGMAMALVSARLMSQALAGHPEAAAQMYAAAWHRAIDKPLWLQNLLRRAAQSAVLQEAVVVASRAFPPLFHWLTQKTRLESHENIPVLAH